MSTVTVVCPNARRCSVKVTPSMLIRQIIEEACLKHGFDVNEFDARNQNKVVDLALPFRLSGLPNNATLELIPSTRIGAGSADIALQMPDGLRKMASLVVNTTLHDMLVSFGPQFGQDLVATEAGLPSCMYMNKQYTGQELQSITLSGIGINSGKCLIRYQRVQLSTEDAAKLEARLAEEAEKKSSLNAKFELMRKENEERDRIEAERLKIYEEDMRQREAAMEVERQRIAAEQVNEQAMDTSEPPGILGDVTSFTRDRMPTPPSQDNNQWSFDAPAYSAPAAPVAASDRLNRLNRLLQQVEGSLAHGAHDNIADVLADGGRIPLSQIAEAATVMEAEQSSSSAASEAAPVIPEPCDRNALVFTKVTTSDGSPTSEMDQVPDEFFEVNTDDVKKMQRELREQARQETQRALLPKTFVEKKNRDLKITAYRHSVIRLTLGTTIVQANFQSGEPTSRIFEFFSSVLNEPREFLLNFALNSPVERSPTKNLVDVNLAPRSTLFVKFAKSTGSTDLPSLLIREALRECTQNEADAASAEWLSGNTVFRPFTGVQVVDEPQGVIGKRVAARQSQQGSSSGQDEHRSPPPKVSGGPKWLKFGGK